MELKRKPLIYQAAIATIWLVALIVAIGFSVYFGSELVRFGEGEKKQSAFEGELRISLIDWIGYYPIVVASQNGFLDRNIQDTGVTVELFKAEHNGETNDLIRTGKVHGTFGVLPDFVVLCSLATPLQVVMATDYSKSDVIIAKKSIRTPKDLVGKRIGIGELNSFAEYFIIRSLESAGIDRQHVSFKTISPMKVPEAIHAGEIDAGYTFEPALGRALAGGLNVVLSSAAHPEMVISGLAFRNEVLVDPSIATAIIRAYYEGLKVIQDRPEESALIVAKFFGRRPEDIQRSFKDDALFVSAAANLKAFQTGGTVHREVLSINKFFSQRGIRQTEESLSHLLNRAPMTAVVGSAP